MAPPRLAEFLTFAAWIGIRAGSPGPGAAATSTARVPSSSLLAPPSRFAAILSTLFFVAMWDFA